MGRKKSRFFPDTPTIFEALKLTPDQEWLFDFRATVEDLGRILVVPPNLPAARLAYLQAAVKKALSDPALIAEGERTQRYVDYLDAEPTREAALKVVESISPEQRQRVKAILSKSQCNSIAEHMSDCRGLSVSGTPSPFEGKEPAEERVGSGPTASRLHRVFPMGLGFGQKKDQLPVVAVAVAAVPSRSGSAASRGCRRSRRGAAGEKSGGTRRDGAATGGTCRPGGARAEAWRRAGRQGQG